jgi:DNA modification methylase
MSLLSASERFKIVKEDCITGMAKMPEACIDLSVFSPPFSLAICLHERTM